MGMRREWGFFNPSLSHRCMCVNQHVHLHIRQTVPQQKELANYTHPLEVLHKLFVVP